MLPGQAYVVSLQKGTSAKEYNFEDSPFTIIKTNDANLELLINKGTNINDLISYFNTKNIHIKSLSHKTNPVESIFDHLTNGEKP